MALSDMEIVQLVTLLKKMEWPIDSRVFRVLCNKTVSVPIELAVLNSRDEILMFYRKDEEYDGYHIPGTVIQDTDSVQAALQRLLQNEVISGDEHISSPKYINWMEIPKGNDHGQNPTRHEISLIYACWLNGPYKGKDGEFYPLDDLPENTLSHHRVLISEVQRWLSKNPWINN